MRKIKLQYFMFLIAIFSGSFLIGCGGGSNSNSPTGKNYNNYTGTALALPGSIDFSGANSTRATSLSNSQSLSPLAATDPGTDYSTDPVDHFVLVNGNFAQEILNVYLCLMESLAAESNINDGPYKTTLDIRVCQKTRSDSSEASLYEFVVDSYRVDDDSPHIIQLWFEDNTMDDPVKIVGEFTINEGVSAAYPYGLFSFRYAIYSDIDPSTGENWQMTDIANANSLQGSNSLPRLEFIFDSDETHLENPGQFLIASVTQLNSAALNSGQTRTRTVFEQAIQGQAPFISDTESAAAFNPDNMLTEYALPQNSTGPSMAAQCFSRNQIIEEVWAYNLYYADDDPVNNRTAGQRVPMTAGDSLSFVYTHTVANDRNDIVLTENPVNLTYHGDGQLYGLPFSIDSFVTLYNLRDGTVLTSNEVTPVNYITKGVDVAETSAQVDVQNCAGLDVTAVFNNATIDPQAVSEVTAPSVGLSDWPNI